MILKLFQFQESFMIEDILITQFERLDQYRTFFIPIGNLKTKVYFQNNSHFLTPFAISKMERIIYLTLII